MKRRVIAEAQIGPEPMDRDSHAENMAGNGPNASEARRITLGGGSFDRRLRDDLQDRTPLFAGGLCGGGKGLDISHAATRQSGGVSQRTAFARQRNRSEHEDW